LEGREDEFRELADAFDSMLARLEAQVAEQQRFAANASHELRTPLAITLQLPAAPPHRRGVWSGADRDQSRRRPTLPGVTAAATTAVFATGEGPGVTAFATTAVFATG